MSAKHKATRSSEATIAKRVEDIFGLVVDGQPLRVIRQYAADSCGWKVDDRTLRCYMKRATGLIKARSEETCEHVREVAVQRLERLYSRCVQVGDRRTALAVQQEIARLHGLNAPSKTELTGAGGAPLITTADEMARRFEQLVEAQAARLKVSPKP